MGRNRVVVTGLGPITPIGVGVESFWDSIVAGRSGARAVDFAWLRDRTFRSQVGAPVEDLDGGRFNMSERERALLDPASQLAISATLLALEDAGLPPALSDERRGRYRIDGVDPNRAGVVIGTGIGGLSTVESSHGSYVRGEPITGHARFSLPMLIPNAPSAQVAIKYGLHGECKSVSTACATGTMAVGDAFRLIREGELDLVVAGGVDKTLSDFDGYSMYGFELLKTMSTQNHDPARASRPFDADRDGFVLGEGAGLLILERAEHAQARGARAYAEIVAYASTCEAHSMLQLHPSGDQIVRVMRAAIERSGLSRGDFGYVNAHGTSTRLNDVLEAKALHRVFGRRIQDILVNSTKAMTGHCIAASGGIEAIVSALSLFRGLVHRCVNLENPDPECDLALPRENAKLEARAAFSSSFGFGGHNAVLAFREA